MASARRVLVIDGPPETGEVLKAVLEPRGLTVDRRRGWPDEDADEQSEAALPSLLVVHDDNARRNSHADNLRSVPRVIIGSLELRETSDDRGTAGKAFLEKPFQYRDLIRAIERLLG